MKKKLLTATAIFFTFFFTANAQQWAGGTPGNIYYLYGNVGVGTSSPNTNLEINNGSYSNDNQLILSGAEYHRYYAVMGTFVSSGQTVFTMGTTSNFANYFRTLNLYNGNVGIGTTTPQAKLEVSGNIKLEGGGWYQAGTNNWFGSANVLHQAGAAISDLGLRTDGNTIFMKSGGYESARFDSNGNLGLGATDTKGYKLAVNGNHRQLNNCKSVSLGRLCF